MEGDDSRPLFSDPVFRVQGLVTEGELKALYVDHVVRECGGNKAEAARKMGIDRRSLYRRLAGKKTK